MFESSDSAETEGVSSDGTSGTSVTTCKKVLCSNSLLDSTEYWLHNNKALCRISFLEDRTETSCSTICFVNLDRHNTGCSDGGRTKSPSADVCLVQCVGGQRPAQTSSLVFEINKFLIGLESGRESGRESQPCSFQVSPRVEDDASHSISSTEDDFLTASEHVGDESEEEAFQNDAAIADVAQPFTDEGRGFQPKGPGQHLGESEKSENFRNQDGSRDSAGRYASNLAESVLQDAFIRLSRDETSLSPQVAVRPTAGPPEDGPQLTHTCSFELPKIIIVQSPDAPEEETVEWLGASMEKDTSCPSHPEQKSEPCGFLPSGHPPKPVELALACAANVIGTISSPQVTEHLTGPGDGGVKAGEQDPSNEADYSLPSAICSMAQVAGAVAAVELAEEARDSRESYFPSLGFLSAAQASAGITLHCSVDEGSSINVSPANIAQVLLTEACTILRCPDELSVRDFLKSSHIKIANNITGPKNAGIDEREVEEFAHVVADSVFQHVLYKARKRYNDVQNVRGFLLENVSNLLFDVLCLTSKKMCEISKSNDGSVDEREDEVKEATCSVYREPFNPNPNQLQNFNGSTLSDDYQKKSLHHCINLTSAAEENCEEQETAALDSPYEAKRKDHLSTLMKDCSDSQDQSKRNSLNEIHSAPTFLDRNLPSQDVLSYSGSGTVCEKNKGRDTNESECKLSLTPQDSLSTTKMDQESRSPVSCFADDLATTVVSMATELAAICLENSSGKQPWFCALKGSCEESSDSYLRPFRAAARRKHRPPRLGEIKRKTEEQPELMERLVNRVVDESLIPDQSPDPCAVFASAVTAKIMSCPELSIVDTSKPDQPLKTRSQSGGSAGDHLSRGKAASYDSIPEEEAADSGGFAQNLGSANRLGQNLSRGSSISKQSSCESITDEFSRFMVTQMENEGRGFDLLLDYYAGENASRILSSAVHQVASRRNGHLNVRNTCLSKQSSTESITEEFYRFMLRDMDKENKDSGLSKTREWSNSLLPPSPRAPFCVRQSSMPDRRSSDSRLAVNSPIKANSFDGFARNSHGDTLSVCPSNTVSATGLCKSDSCLYRRGQTDQVTDMLIHETWSSSIESLMRKNKIIVDPEDSVDLQPPHVELFADRLAADIVESGRSVLGSQTEGVAGWKPRPVGERRRGFQQSRPSWGIGGMSSQNPLSGDLPRQPREVPLIHIEGDHRDEPPENYLKDQDYSREQSSESPPPASPPEPMSRSSSEGEGAPAVDEKDQLLLSASSEESWSHVTPDLEPPEETSSYIQLSEGNGNSSSSSLGLADLEAFTEILPPCEAAENDSTKGLQENVDEEGRTSYRELLVVNFDLDPESVDTELRVTLQWIAASELGVTTIYFNKSPLNRVEKFLKVVQLVNQKCWRVGDLFHAVVQYCRLQDESGDSMSGLFDWLLAVN